MLHELWGVSIWQVGIATIPGPVSDRHFSLQSCKVLLSPASVSSHKCDDSYSAEHTMEFSGVFCLCGSLHSGFFCKLQLHWSSPTLSSVSSIQSICWALPEFLLAPWPGNVLKAVSCGNHKAYLICFLSLCPSLSDVYCLEKHCFIYFACIFVWLGCRVSLVSPTPSLLGTEMVHWNL